MNQEPITLPEGFDDPEIKNELLGLFIEQCQESKPSIEQAVTNNDATQLKLLVHTVKGMVSNLGLNSLATLCQQVEMNPEQSIKDGLIITQITEYIEDALNQAKAML